HSLLRSTTARISRSTSMRSGSRSRRSRGALSASTACRGLSYCGFVMTASVTSTSRALGAVIAAKIPWSTPEPCPLLPAPDHQSPVHRRVIPAEVVADCRVRDEHLPRGILGQPMRIPAFISCGDGMWNEVSIDPLHYVARICDDVRRREP